MPFIENSPESVKCPHCGETNVTEAFSLETLDFFYTKGMTSPVISTCRVCKKDYRIRVVRTLVAEPTAF